MWVISAEVGTSAEGFRVTPGPWPAPAPASPGSLQFPPTALPWAAARRPPDRLLAAPPPSLAGGGAGLALYVQTPDQPHSAHYVNIYHITRSSFFLLAHPLYTGS